jgi:uncharacterized protein
MIVKEPLQIGKKPTAPEWPHEGLLNELPELDWQPMPFNQFILKIHSRCNLACDYCYLYEMADDTWRDQPGVMSMEVAERAARRIAQHVERHEVESVNIVLHGGEPLLAGLRRLESILEVFDAALRPITEVHYRVQTNALLMSSEFLELFDRFDVRIGISLDGGREENDKHRKRRNGVGTYAVVAERLKTLRDGPHSALLGTILAAIDVTNDPLRTYKSLRSFNPPRIDFLLPHGTWDSLPPHLGDDSTPYADWLIPIFDYWFASEDAEPGIRIFEQIIRLIYGMPSQVESIGLERIALVTVQTDGAYELVDTLKSTFNGAAATSKNIFDHELDDLLYTPDVIARQIGRDALSKTCLACEVSDVCGGGYYPHRYRQGSGFRNPSVYCQDLMKLIKHLRNVIGPQNVAIMRHDHPMTVRATPERW